MTIIKVKTDKFIKEKYLNQAKEQLDMKYWNEFDSLIGYKRLSTEYGMNAFLDIEFFEDFVEYYIYHRLRQCDGSSTWGKVYRKRLPYTKFLDFNNIEHELEVKAEEFDIFRAS